jgi:hypothetical protein
MVKRPIKSGSVTGRPSTCVTTFCPWTVLTLIRMLKLSRAVQVR